MTLPDSVTEIGRCAFVGCTGLTITIPNSVTSIEYHAFYGVSKVICDNPGFTIKDYWNWGAMQVVKSDGTVLYTNGSSKGYID